MIITESKQNVITNMTGQENTFSIAQNAFMAELLSRKLYTNPELAVVRELICNALDASLNRVDVGLPSSLSPTFTVRDYGTGLSKEDMLCLYSTYGFSTKRSDNTQIGGFGVGSKSPFALTDTFTVSSVYQGVRTDYVCYKDNGFPKIKEVQSAHTDEHSGLCVSVPIKNVSSFNAEANSWLSDAFMLGYTGINVNHIEKRNVLIETEEFIVLKTGAYFSHSVYIAMGPTKYKAQDVRIDKLRYGYDLVLKANIGDYPVSASRESIEIDSKVKEDLQQRVDRLLSEYIDKKSNSVLLSDRMKLKDIFSAYIDVEKALVDHMHYVKDTVYNDIPHTRLHNVKFLKYLSSKYNKKLSLTKYKNVLNPEKTMFYSDLVARHYADYLKLLKRKRGEKKNIKSFNFKGLNTGWLYNTDQLLTEDIKVTDKGVYGPNVLVVSTYILNRIRKLHPEAVLKDTDVSYINRQKLKKQKADLKDKCRVIDRLNDILNLPAGLRFVDLETPLALRYRRRFGDAYEKLRELLNDSCKHRLVAWRLQPEMYTDVDFAIIKLLKEKQDGNKNILPAE
jgi:hypothetical protein